MEDIGSFETSDERLNRLTQNIWWSQVANTISIPSDCSQREKAGWICLPDKETVTVGSGRYVFAT